jgi:GntR family transcriptional repressor for pyruvate dehydrogenase complex
MKPIKKVTATEAIVESLKQRIGDGEFGPGEQLPSEQVLLHDYGVSRLTLREALARLSALGIIHVHHGKGAFVEKKISVSALGNVLMPMFPECDLKRMNDLIEARNVIESEIAAKVAESHTEDDIRRLQDILDCRGDILDNPEIFAERDYAFHLALVEIADNQFFFAMYQALHRQIKAFLVQYARSITDRAQAMERHRPVLKAIIKGDADKARKLAREHAAICASYVKKMIDSKGDVQ